MATETRMTANAFQREHPQLDGSGRYFRFNVTQGLEKVALEEHNKKNIILAATRSYVKSQDVHTKLQRCGNILAGRPLETIVSHMPLFEESEDVAEPPPLPSDYAGYTGKPGKSMVEHVVLLLNLRAWDWRWVWFLRSLAVVVCVSLLLLLLNPAPIHINHANPNGSSYHGFNHSKAMFAIMGRTGVGKSNFIDVLGGRHVETGSPPEVGHGLESCKYSSNRT